MSPMPVADDISLSRVVGMALAARDLSGLEEMLKEIAKQCQGFGVTLWQAGEHNRLFVLAHGFEDEKTICAYHALPLDTATGKCLELGECEVPDCEADPGVDKENDFYKQEHPGSLFSVRIRFQEKTPGAVTLYRREKGQFPEPVKNVFKLFAERVPDLYDAILNRVSYELVESISDALDQANQNEPNEPEEVLQTICGKIGDALKATEVSIFLEDWLEEPKVIKRRATTCEQLLRKLEYRLDDDGFTPYVWREQKPLRVLDVLSTTEEFRLETRWTDAMNIKKAVRVVLNLDETQVTPPISFAAVPIRNPDRVMGVLRCHLRRRTPYYFAERETELLKIIAARIGFYWFRRQRMREHESSKKSWVQFVDRLNGLSFNNQSLRAHPGAATFVAKKAIFREALLAIKEAVAGLDILDVALLDSNRKQFTTVVIEGSPKTLKLNAVPSTDNSWAHVYQSKLPAFISDTSQPEIPYQDLFPGVRQAMFIPIMANEECIGIVSLRSLTTFREGEKTMRMGSLVALVVSFYELAATMMAAQSRIYQELEHQLRTPVFQAKKRAGWMLTESAHTSPPLHDLQAVNGLLAKTNRVLRNMRIYEELALTGKVQARMSTAPIGSIYKLLAEACNDHRTLWRSRELEFSFDSRIFDDLKIKELKVDQALLEQVINNVLDNAAKYSERASKVTITAHIESDRPTDRRLVVTFKNQAGIELTRDDVNCLGDRGFRSVAAVRRTAEGSGLGAYIAKKIMEAHGGELRAIPTDLGVTRIELVFILGGKA